MEQGVDEKADNIVSEEMKEGLNGEVSNEADTERTCAGDRPQSTTLFIFLHLIRPLRIITPVFNVT